MATKIFKNGLIILTGLTLLFCTTQPKKLNWIQYNSKNGKFSITVPDNPSTINCDTLSFPKYGQVIHNQFIFHLPGNDSIAYSIQYDDYPEFQFKNDKSKIDTFFIESIDNMQIALNGGINYNSSIKYKDFSGREILMTTKTNRKILIRKYIIGERHYSLMVFFTADYLENEKMIYKFLNSFDYIK